jgi:hypothetical protein
LSDDIKYNTGSILKDFQLTEDIAAKLSDDYGRKIAMYIRSTTLGTSNSYYYNRNARFRLNRNMANGRLDIKAMFGDRLDYNGKINYSNLNWKAPAIVSTTISRKIGQWMARNEKIQVQAIDPFSVGKKNDIEEYTKFVFEHKDNLQSMEQASGVPLIPKDTFIAEDKDELDQWCTEFNHLPEEIKYELGCNNILEQNSWFDILKEKMLRDSCEVGLIGTYTYMNEQGEVVVQWIKAENCLYSYSEYQDFRDTTWRGHVSTMKISEVRKKYGKQFGGKLSEEQLFELAATAKEYQLYDKISWLQEWNVTFIRPYDEWNIDIINFELRSLDKEHFTVTKTKLNGSTLINKGVPKKVKENQEIIEDSKWNIYKGVYAPTNDLMLEWGIKNNMIRPQDPKELGNAEFSYSFYMYQNYDMRNLAIPEKIEEPVEQMILARLKIQQLVAKMTPAGAAINIDAMQELDLGLATGNTSPIEAQRLWEQTGKLYYRGRDAEGNPIPMPITEMANTGFAPQLRALIELYQFHYQVLKDELGEDPNLQQQAAQPRVTEGNIQTAIQQADNATDYMYDAYLYVMQDTAKKIACLLNSSVSNGAKKYSHILKEDEVKDRNFSTKIQMLPTGQEIAELKMMLNTAIASNPQFAVYCDQFKIARIAKEDVELAELYYRQAMKRMIKSEQENAQKNAEQNAQIQQASAQAKAQMDAQLMQQELDMKGAMEDNLSKNRKEEIILTGIFNILSKGLQMPTEWKGIESELIASAGTELFHQNQIAVAAEQQAAQQQVQQQSPQEEQVEQQQGTQEPQQQEMMEQPQQQVA